MPESYIIDGIGNEVTITFGILLAVFVVIVSWLSTRVSDPSLATDDVLRNNANVNVTSQATSEANQAENQPNQSENEGLADQSPATSDTAVRQELASRTSSENVTELRHRHTTQSAPDSQRQEQSSSQTVSIRLKFMDETSQTVQASPDETLESFRRRSLPVETQSRYRLIYGGQVLRENGRTLRQLNLVRDTSTSDYQVPVIHCFLSPTVETEGENLSASQQMHMVSEELNIGSLLLPILGLCLLCMWYLCIFHTSLFSIQSVVSIVGFTFLYIALVANHFL